MDVLLFSGLVLCVIAIAVGCFACSFVLGSIVVEGRRELARCIVEGNIPRGIHKNAYELGREREQLARRREI